MLKASVSTIYDRFMRVAELIPHYYYLRYNPDALRSAAIMIAQFEYSLAIHFVLPATQRADAQSRIQEFSLRDADFTFPNFHFRTYFRHLTAQSNIGLRRSVRSEAHFRFVMTSAEQLVGLTESFHHYNPHGFVPQQLVGWLYWRLLRTYDDYIPTPDDPERLVLKLCVKAERGVGGDGGDDSFSPPPSGQPICDPDKPPKLGEIADFVCTMQVFRWWGGFNLKSPQI